MQIMKFLSKEGRAHGRNGYCNNVVGLELFEIDGRVSINPVSQRTGKRLACSIDVPVEDIPRLMESLGAMLERRQQ